MWEKFFFAADRQIKFYFGKFKSVEHVLEKKATEEWNWNGFTSFVISFFLVVKVVSFLFKIPFATNTDSSRRTEMSFGFVTIAAWDEQSLNCHFIQLMQYQSQMKGDETLVKNLSKAIWNCAQAFHSNQHHERSRQEQINIKNLTVVICCFAAWKDEKEF